MELTNALAVGYVEPALKGHTITFSRPPGQTLNGSNSSTCMENGEWEPNPGEVDCIGEMGTTSSMSALSINIILYLFITMIIILFILFQR